MPVPPKPANRRQRRNDRHEVGPLLPVADDHDIPEPDEEWLPETLAEWRDYWSSDVSGLVSTAGDMSAVRRLFAYRDEHTRALQSYRRHRLSYGAAGQAVISPMGQMMLKLEAMILPLEDRYGLSALARLRLGAQLNDTTKSLAEMNAALVAEVTGGDDAGDENHDAEVVELPGLPRAQ